MDKHTTNDENFFGDYLFSNEILLSVFGDRCHFSNGNFLVENVVIDSRKVKRGSLFITIRGEVNDGHEFIKDAIEHGAVCVICEYIPDYMKEEARRDGIDYILVEDSLRALAELAVFHRSRIPAKVIGITGNIGKTSTKEMIRATVSRFCRTFANFGNYNNNIGLPLTIVNTPLDTEVLVLEMGMNHPREIEFLTNIAKPDIAIITKISQTHIGNFKDVDEIVACKAEIFTGMNGDGVAFLNKSDKYYDKLADFARKSGITDIVSIGDDDDADIYADNFEFCDDFTTKYDVVVRHDCKSVETIPCRISGLSRHRAINSLFSLAVANEIGIRLEDIAGQIERSEIVEGRGNLFELTICSNDSLNKRISVIDDTYNSSPEALKASIETLGILKRQRPNSRVVAIIGDMLELGESSDMYHRGIVDVLRDNDIRVVITIGSETRVIHEVLKRDADVILNDHYDTTDCFISKICDFVEDGDVVLLKSSHGLHFDRLVEELKKHSI